MGRMMMTAVCGAVVAAITGVVSADDGLRLLPQPEAPSPPAAPAPATAEAEKEVQAMLNRVDPVWRVQVEPAAWYVAPSGKIKTPVSAGSGGGSFTTAGNKVPVERMNLDSPRFEPAGELHVSSERWRFSFSGATFGLDRDGTVADSSFRMGAVPVASGDAMNVSLDFTTIELTGGYRVWGRDFMASSEHPEKAIDAVLRVYALAGARFYDVSFSLTNLNGGASTGSDQTFGEPIVGGRAELDLADDFTVDVQVSAGGFVDSDRSSYSIDVIAGFQWRPTRHVGVQIGYRQLAFGLYDGEDADEFQYDGRLAGLYAGLAIRF